ncbi:hypothetical protein CPCC7001_2683 [Cyanobium sp. PCC 7001]|uniref:AAA family ATPase n=1 Tax=Cyanobium sp. PCC 7001 TaxID=180281 RepID=UPI0001804CCD|nr:AAA family ATPase [Cyanobium sp. PCC 7001]EDY39802.1 hypothetical protein CPCC7001_2683 [Cyanobium sp. PCC 7001]
MTPILLVSLHQGHHNKTPKDAFSEVENSCSWIPAELTPEELVNHIKAGKAWTSCQFQGERCNENYQRSNLMALDIDGDLDLEDWWAHPMVQRHCAFTYTTPSHGSLEKQQSTGSPSAHRFRAVFIAEPIDDPELHRARTELLVQRLDLKVRDACGAKPLQIWFGNDAADLQYGDAEPFGWEFTEDARELLKRKEAEAAAAKVDVSPEDHRRDCARAAWALRTPGILRPSEDGEYEYWHSVFQAAAGAADEDVKLAFQLWHDRCHHSKTQQLSAGRWARSGRRSGPGKILKLVAEQHGKGWWRLMPEELRGGGGPTRKLPRSFYSSRPPEAPVLGEPDPMPRPAAPEPQEPRPRGRSLMGDRAPDAISTSELQKLKNDRSTQPGGSAGDRPTHLMLWRLYRLTVDQVHVTDRGERKVSAQEAEQLIDDYRSNLFEWNLYNREPWRIDAALLRFFSDDQGLPRLDQHAFPVVKLADIPETVTRPLIPGLLDQGRTYMIHAKAGAGKTTMALFIARAALGAPGYTQFMDFGAVSPNHYRHRRALIIASDGASDAARDIRNYARSHGMLTQEWAQQYVDVRFESISAGVGSWRMTLAGLKRLMDTIHAARDRGEPYDLLVIDSLKTILPPGVRVGEQVVSDYVDLLIRLCSAQGITLLIVHHSAKGADHAQGVAALSELTAGVFRLEVRDGQRFFIVEKSRLGPQREIPYSIEMGEVKTLHDEDQQDEARRLLLGFMQEHYEAHKAKANPGPYQGLKRDDLRRFLGRHGHPNAIKVRAGRNDLIEELRGEGLIDRMPKANRFAVLSAILDADPDRQSEANPSIWDDL